MRAGLLFETQTRACEIFNNKKFYFNSSLKYHKTPVLAFTQRLLHENARAAFLRISPGYEYWIW